MARDSVCTTANVQNPYTGTVSSTGCHWLGICLEGLTTADLESLYAMMMRWRGRVPAASFTPPADDAREGGPGPADVPLLSIGPSGLGGVYQTEF